MQHNFSKIILILWVFIMAGTLIGCKDGTMLLSREQEIQLGQDAADTFEKENKLLTDKDLNNLIDDIGERVARAAMPPEYPYDFRIVDSKEVNAAAFPGGRIYVFRGLIDAFKKDRDMLAWVIGHEIAHVAKQHSAKRIEKQLGVEVLSAYFLGDGISGYAAGLVSSLVFQYYGRDNELQADEWGLVYSDKAGFDATAALQVIKVFQSIHNEDDPGDLELLFMTHPGDNTRINEITRQLQKRNITGKYYSAPK